MIARALLAAGAVIAAGGCAERPAGSAPIPPAPQMRFTTLGPDETGLDVTLVSGRTPSTQIVEVNGSGLALLDFDGDGDLDLFIGNGATMDAPEDGPGCRLYENTGGMAFRDVTRDAGIDVRRWTMGVTVGDYDGDGRDDLYLTCFGPNILLRNEGGRFTDVTETAGVGDPRWGTSSAFGDLDQDGDLDLYVVNYLEFDLDDPPQASHFRGVEVMAGPNGLPPQADVLYENLGDGTFRDVTGPSGVGDAPPAYGLGVVILDVDDDGRQDIFVGNDSVANFLFHNLGDGRFEEVGGFAGLAANAEGGEQATMGIGVADVDDNGRPDFFTTNFSSDTNTLQVNLDGRFFDDRTLQYGLAMVSRPYLGWSCGFYDFDLDGDEDLLMVNGHVYPQASMRTMDSWYEQEPLLFEREADRFERVTDPAVGEFLAEAHADRAAAFGDLDGDGDIDAVIGGLYGPLRVLRCDTSGGWIEVELAGPRLGSRIDVVAGDRRWRRWIYGGGFQSSSAQSAHVGLPADVETVDIEVRWPDGSVQRHQNVEANQRVVVTQGQPELTADR